MERCESPAEVLEPIPNLNTNLDSNRAAILLTVGCFSKVLTDFFTVDPNDGPRVGGVHLPPAPLLGIAGHARCGEHIRTKVGDNLKSNWGSHLHMVQHCKDQGWG